MPSWIPFVIILVVMIGALVGLYFFGRKQQK